MRVWLVVVVLVGCARKPGGYEQLKELHETRRGDLVAEVSAVTARGDAAALARMMLAPMEYGGLWFPDETCRQLFEKPGTISAAAVEALAECVATLRLVKSERQHPYQDVAVFTYEPGFEVEVAFTDDYRLRYIGFASRREQEGRLPTVTPLVFQALQVDPTPIALPPGTRVLVEREMEARADGDRHVFAWFKVCIDTAGAVTAVHPRETSSVLAMDAYAAALRNLRLRPFVIGGQPAPACSLVHVGDGDAATVTAGLLPHPVPASRPTGIVLRHGGLGTRLAGSEVMAPDEETRAALFRKNRKVVASLVFCLDAGGQVDTVVLRASSGVRGFDRAVIDGVRRWKFEPRVLGDHAIHACGDETFIFGRSRIVNMRTDVPPPCIPLERSEASPIKPSSRCQQR